MRKYIKSKLGHLAYLLKMHELTLRNHIPILAFHKISNESSDDGLTLGIKEFRSFCDFLSERFTVLPLSIVLEKLENNVSFMNDIAITFDDGYRNNFELAAPVLNRLGLNASFFVTTQFIGSDFVPWWDKKLGIRHPWMTWDQVRELHRMGFEIGSHTRNHIDLGRVPSDETKVELFLSKMELEDQLSSRVTLFAYPYGGVENMCQENLELVKAAGYSCCCSCYGGLNKNGADPYSLRRIPVSSWYRSPQDYYFQLIMHRV